MHFHSVSKLHVYDVKFKGKMESICQCITLLHVLHLKSDTLTEILQSHYTHYTLKSLQCDDCKVIPHFSLPGRVIAAQKDLSEICVSFLLFCN